jgi:hypothetical protein
VTVQHKTDTDDEITINTSNAELSDGKKISFEAPSTNTGNVNITVVNSVTEGTNETVGPFPLYKSETDESGNHVSVSAKTMLSGKYYVIQYYKTLNCFYFIGQMQPHAMCMLKDTAPTDTDLTILKQTENCDNLKIVCTSDPAQYDEFHQSRFSIERIGRRNLILSGSDYDNYTTDEGVMGVCQYMLWKNARLVDSISVDMILIPWLEVNQKISYHAKYLGGTVDAQFLIKSINMSLGSRKMTVTMERFYPYYPYIVQNK